MKRYKLWLWVAVVFQFLTGAIHSVSLFVTPAPQNDTERQLLELMSGYKRDLGGGFDPTVTDLMTALSSCFTLLCLLGGLTLAYLMLRRVAPGILKGVATIQVLVFGICFVIMLFFTFLPPIILTGLILATLAAGCILTPVH